MSSNQSCKNSRERQEDLLDCGDGSLVICLCYDELGNEGTSELKIDETSTDMLQVAADKVSIADVAVDATTQSNAGTAPKNGTSDKNMQPPVNSMNA